MTLEASESTVTVTDRHTQIPSLYLSGTRTEFQADPQWWYRRLYRVDLARGQDATEDIYSPGVFVWQPGRKKTCRLTASLGEPIKMKFKTTISARRQQQAEFVAAVRESPTATRRMAAAASLYVVDRPTSGSAIGTSILAGFPWFADWGRDTFIALPGLLLCTKQFELAKRVFRTYAEHLRGGMIPNRFDDYGGAPHYNSADASLWFCLAAERYVRATEDLAFWHEVLLPACESIVTHYTRGTEFDIRADADSLLTAGRPGTQLTWMDAKLGEEVLTSRWGKAVELNALWYCIHRILADRCREADLSQADHYADSADRIATAFQNAFWNEQFQWLNDVVNDEGPDASLRPNQIFAVSLPHTPLTPPQQRSVLRAISDCLLTPFGLRTLSPKDLRYRSRYAGCAESRERAYHQGTVWAWLMGPFIEAYLKVEDAVNNPQAVARAREWLVELDGHLHQAGLGQISEIFDGTEPHAPRGCFAQAWSVAEVLRANLLVAEHEAFLEKRVAI
jgi:predicted glycogen debranching enzyme